MTRPGYYPDDENVVVTGHGSMAHLIADELTSEDLRPRYSTHRLRQEIAKVTEEHARRVQDLLEANNRYLERARAAEARVRELEAAA